MSDWREPQDYEYTEGLSHHQWAWEFLRRNPQYRAKWAEYSRRSVSPANTSDFYASIPFGLRTPYDPSLSATEHGELLWIAGAVLFDQLDMLPSDTDVPWPGFPRYIPILFRADWTVDTLLEAARPILEEQKSQVDESRLVRPWAALVRHHPDRFQNYLRLLDGRDAGASKREMSRVIFKAFEDGGSRARRALKVADDLARDGYRALLQRPDEPGGG